MFIVALSLLTFLFVVAKPAQAYLDPGTGSYITQLAVGFLIGGSFILKTQWQTIVGSLKQRFNRSEKPDNVSPDEKKS